MSHKILIVRGEVPWEGVSADSVLAIDGVYATREVLESQIGFDSTVTDIEELKRVVLESLGASEEAVSFEVRDQDLAESIARWWGCH